ncbi:fimbrial protein [uncultured Cedecea sp.]|uniref:fimbrial protein n=1 Tax=uncultured Cedecea sp. TaxID=988762 RepID=UPI00260A13C8|nr:fimbrial protein [uncultured Cedecea sp.]
MKLKSIAVATVASLGLISTAMAADEGHGKITFFGSIIDAPCSIKAGDEEQLINLGQISNVALQDGGKSEPVNFAINLEGCQFGDPAAKNKVTVTFTGAASDVNADLLGITGPAKGAGVAMTAQGGAELIKLDTPTAPQTLTDGNNTLSFAAYMQGEGAGTAIVEGAFQAVTDFKLSYN